MTPRTRAVLVAFRDGKPKGRPNTPLWTDGRSLYCRSKALAWQADDTNSRHVRIPERARITTEAKAFYAEMCAFFSNYHVGVTYCKRRAEPTPGQRRVLNKMNMIYELLEGMDWSLSCMYDGQARNNKAVQKIRACVQSALLAIRCERWMPHVPDLGRGVNY